VQPRCRSLGVWLVVAALLGCSNDVSPDDGSASSTTGTETSSSGASSTGTGSSTTEETGTAASTETGGTQTTSSNECTAIGSCCDDIDGMFVEHFCDANGFPQCPAGASWSEEGVCLPGPGSACAPTLPCRPGHYCDYLDDLCGDGEHGRCRTLPRCGTPEPGNRVCGCDGRVYEHACAAWAAGFDDGLAEARCGAPAETVACGTHFCTAPYYCEILERGSSHGGNVYACVPWPEACSETPTCECLGGQACESGTCETDANGRVTVVCPEGG